MKILKLVILGIVLFIAGTARAQVSINFSIGTPPLWGPVGYSDVQYYYLPDVEAYYDVHSSLFIYYEGNSWIRRSYLPNRYRNYDLYHGYKVVMNDYHGNTPYTHFYQQKNYYANGYHRQPQRTNGERARNVNHTGSDYSGNNQANRGRYTGYSQNGNYDRKNDDNNYDKHGREKSDKNNHGNQNHNKK
jgi:hypothetical protein